MAVLVDHMLHGRDVKPADFSMIEVHDVKNNGLAKRKKRKERKKERHSSSSFLRSCHQIDYLAAIFYLPKTYMNEHPLSSIDHLWSIDMTDRWHGDIASRPDERLTMAGQFLQGMA